MVANNSTSISQSIVKFWKDEEAATAVEYGLIAALIGAVIMATVATLGTNLRDMFSSVSGKIAGRAS